MERMKNNKFTKTAQEAVSDREPQETYLGWVIILKSKKKKG